MQYFTSSRILRNSLYYPVWSALSLVPPDMAGNEADFARSTLFQSCGATVSAPSKIFKLAMQPTLSMKIVWFSLFDKPFPGRVLIKGPEINPMRTFGCYTFDFCALRWSNLVNTLNLLSVALPKRLLLASALRTRFKCECLLNVLNDICFASLFPQNFG